MLGACEASDGRQLCWTNFRLVEQYANGSRIRFVRSSANPLFSSAAHAFGERLIAIALTGGDRDATDGVQSVHGAGGMVIAQNRATSEDFAMPKSAIDTGCVDRVMPLEEIGRALVDLVSSPESEREVMDASE
jgi:two-component system chemotaxis response regulator CheB